MNIPLFVFQQRLKTLPFILFGVFFPLSSSCLHCIVVHMITRSGRSRFFLVLFLASNSLSSFPYISVQDTEEAHDFSCCWRIPVMVLQVYYFARFLLQTIFAQTDTKREAEGTRAKRIQSKRHANPS